MAKLYYVILTILPLIPSILLLIQYITQDGNHNNHRELLVYIVMACIGYISTYKLIPKISNYTLRKGICGKDLGKRGTEIADKLV